MVWTQSHQIRYGHDLWGFSLSYETMLSCLKRGSKRWFRVPLTHKAPMSTARAQCVDPLCCKINVSAYVLIFYTITENAAQSTCRIQLLWMLIVGAVYNKECLIQTLKIFNILAVTTC